MFSDQNFVCISHITLRVMCATNLVLFNPHILVTFDEVYKLFIVQFYPVLVCLRSKHFPKFPVLKLFSICAVVLLCDTVVIYTYEYRCCSGSITSSRI